jgi:hypothetical protein
MGIDEGGIDPIGVHSRDVADPIEPQLLSLPTRMPAPPPVVPVAPVRTAPITSRMIEAKLGSLVTDRGSAGRPNLPVIHPSRQKLSTQRTVRRIRTDPSRRVPTDAALAALQRTVTARTNGGPMTRTIDPLAPGTVPQGISNPDPLRRRRVSISPNELPCPPGFMRLSHV